MHRFYSGFSFKRYLSHAFLFLKIVILKIFILYIDVYVRVCAHLEDRGQCVGTSSSHHMGLRTELWQVPEDPSEVLLETSKGAIPSGCRQLTSSQNLQV